jgi:hypothetical protein
LPGSANSITISPSGLIFAVDPQRVMRARLATLTLSSSRSAVSGPEDIQISGNFVDHCAIEFSEGAAHLKHRLAARRGRIDVALMQVEINPQRVNLGKVANKIL